MINHVRVSTFSRVRRLFLIGIMVGLSGCQAEQAASDPSDLWAVYASYLESAKYIDLTHPFEPNQAVWPGFGTATFSAAVAASDMPGYVSIGDEFKYDQHGFVASAYVLPTDQYGTQLDPPAHWNPVGATISDIPATYAIRPLVVISIAEQVESDPGYALSVKDVTDWESRHGRIPPYSVVMVRSDWHKRWRDIERFNKKPFPGVSLAALKFLHLERDILFHGHEPLDTDTTPTLEGEHWLMHNNFAQAEGVANLDLVPETGALIVIGFAKPLGGTGGFARYVAVVPSAWEHGVSPRDQPGAPLGTQASRLIRDAAGVMRPQSTTTETPE